LYRGLKKEQILGEQATYFGQWGALIAGLLAMGGLLWWLTPETLWWLNAGVVQRVGLMAGLVVLGATAYGLVLGIFGVRVQHFRSPNQ